MIMHDFLTTLGIENENHGGFDGEWIGSGELVESVSPIDGEVIASVRQVTEDEYERIVARAHEAFLEWRKMPAPRRGDIVRQIGNRLRELKTELGQMVTLEMGKIRAEGEGEVQE
ncbi:MAG: aldehyde dehydrogenase family protein, partial [Gemmatimonadales bacterium]